MFIRRLEYGAARYVLTLVTTAIIFLVPSERRCVGGSLLVVYVLHDHVLRSAVAKSSRCMQVQVVLMKVFLIFCAHRFVRCNMRRVTSATAVELRQLQHVRLAVIFTPHPSRPFPAFCSPLPLYTCITSPSLLQQQSVRCCPRVL